MLRLSIIEAVTEGFVGQSSVHPAMVDLYGAEQALLSHAFSGNLRGMGPDRGQPGIGG
jgi:fructose 1,6-bisphosphatase